MPMPFSIVRCYWKHCDELVRYKWHPSRNPESFLWVCKKHFDFLTLIHTVKTVEEGKDYTTVKVIPYPDEETR